MTRVALSISILLILFVGTFSALAGNHNQDSAPPSRTRQIGISGNDQLGIDCGLGSTVAVANSTGVPVAPTENNLAPNPEILSRCTWTGDAGQIVIGSYDGTNEPLVSDQDEILGSTSPAIGGGFTANVVLLQNYTSSVNGFDLQVQYNPAVLRAVEFDQSGLFWNTGSPFKLLSTIDNVHGVAELAQVITGQPIGGNLTLFRIRYDVVGVGITSLHIVNVGGGIVNPELVVHQTLDGSFDSETLFDPGHTLNWSAKYTVSPTPPVPGSPLTFKANASCTGCAGTLSYSWDFSSLSSPTYVSKIDATGNSVTITSPPLLVNRVTLNITDTAMRSVTLT